MGANDFILATDNTHTASYNATEYRTVPLRHLLLVAAEA